jgi:hypothetical protein
MENVRRKLFLTHATFESHFQNSSSELYADVYQTEKGRGRPVPAGNRSIRPENASSQQRRFLTLLPWGVEFVVRRHCNQPPTEIKSRTG